MKYSACVLLAAACGGAGGADGGPTGPTGFGTPTLEVTVNGVHSGPTAPDPTSSASLVDARDATTGRLQQSQFSLGASAQASGAACALTVQRYGDGVAPVDVGSWQITSGTGSASADGEVAPLGAPSVTTAQGSWQCNACGASLQLTHLDADHVEGFFSGTFDGAGGAADVVCSFYLPTRTFSP
jgi:hypothetical protein